MTEEPVDLKPFPGQRTPSDRRRTFTILSIAGIVLLGLTPLALVTVNRGLAGFLALLATISFAVAYLIQRGLQADRWRNEPEDQIENEPLPVVDLGLREEPAPIDLPIGPGRAAFDAVEELLEEHGEHFQ